MLFHYLPPLNRRNDIIRQEWGDFGFVDALPLLQKECDSIGDEHAAEK